MKTLFNTSILVLLVGIYACGPSQQTDSETETDSVTTMDEMGTQQEITLEPVTSSPEYPDASLTLASPQNGDQVAAGSVPFDFEVENYELSVQTADADIKQCANSAKGQHIHLILNNNPYLAFYEADFTHDLDPGHYVTLAFISRSYHESIKTDAAHVLMQFQVGDGDYEMADLDAPHMFYSRPKGEYSGDDIDNLLLDFYLVNTTLSEDGNHVRATINGKEFMITEWQPYFIKGLTPGEVTIKLELMDSEGNLIDSPFNPVERTVTLKE